MVLIALYINNSRKEAIRAEYSPVTYSSLDIFFVDRFAARLNRDGRSPNVDHTNHHPNSAGLNRCELFVDNVEKLLYLSQSTPSDWGYVATSVGLKSGARSMVVIPATDTFKTQKQNLRRMIDGGRKPLHWTVGSRSCVLTTCAIITNMTEKLSSASIGGLFILKRTGSASLPRSPCLLHDKVQSVPHAFPPRADCKPPMNSVFVSASYVPLPTACPLIFTTSFAGADWTPRKVMLASGRSRPE